MQENFRSKFTSKRKRPRFSAPPCRHRPMPVPADWRPLFPKSTYRTFLDIDPEKALLPLRGVPRPAGCPLSGSVLFVSDRNRYRLCSDRAAAREEPAARSRCLCSRCCAVSASPFSLSDGNQHIEFSPIALPCERHEAAASASGNFRFPDRHPRLSRRPGLCPGPLLQG